MPIGHINDNWFFLELSASDKRYFWYLKRASDILASCVGLCLALPLLPFAALLIKLDSRRTAILLIGGDKMGDGRWYDKHIPIADRLYDEHMEQLRKGGLIDG